MSRRLRRTIEMFSTALFCMLLAWGAAATPAVAAVENSVEDFTFSSFHADYLLGRDASGHATLQTTETIVAEFPQIDQNRGIRRAIPNRYRGHPTDLDIVSVTDENGAPRDFESESEDDVTLVTIRSPRYLHGRQTYVITYREKNVVLFPDDTDAPEFFRDVNGTQWRQPFDVVTATVSVEQGLVGAFTGQAACYQGPEGSRTPCTSLAPAPGQRTLLTAEAEALAPSENLTIALAFAPGTFVPRDSSYFASPFAVPQLAAGLLAVLGLVLAVVGRIGPWRDAAGRGTIVAEYEAPSGVGPVLASTVEGSSVKATAAGMLDLAVRGKVRVVDLGGKKGYRLELVDGQGVTGLELELARALFGGGLQPGALRDLKKTDAALGKKLQTLREHARKAALEVGYRRRIRGPLRIVTVITVWLGAAGAVVFGVGVLSGEVGEGAAFGLLAVGVAAWMGALGILFRRPLTAKGAVLREQLKGLDGYIRLAEADRIRVLQSPSGALRSDYRPESRSVPDDGSGNAAREPLSEAEVLKLNERLLPYAVLFGYEKEWSSALGDAYERLGRSPEWYEGADGFSAIAFITTMNSFSNSVARSWSGSSSSSGSSGSGGGGSSGGGGGGGGGGGV